MEQFEQIEAYLAGELTGDALTEFEAKLQGDSQLAEEVRLQKASHQLLQASQQTHYKSFLQDLEKRYQQEAKVIPWYSRPIYQVAAVLLLICLAAVVWFSPSSPPTTTYAEALQPYPNYLSARSGDPLDSLLRVGMMAYDQHQYKLAVQALGAYYEEKGGGTQVELYLGISSLFQKDYAQAINVLKKIPPSTTYWYTGQWYLALALGLNGQEAEAKKILSTIVQDETGLYPYKAEAKKLYKP